MAGQRSSGGVLPILILGVLFFLFGFVTWLNGTLVPYLKIACELDNFGSLLVAFAFYIAYFVMALPSAWVLRRTGLKNGMMTGLLVMAVGALLFVPAARSRTYELFLAGLFIIGTGLSVLQTASNPYITIVGPLESAARRISIMGICNKVAGVLAPIVLGAMVLSDGDELVGMLDTLDAPARAALLDELAARVIGPYLLMAAALVVLGLLVRMSPLPELSPEQNKEEGAEDRAHPFDHPYLVFGVLALFMYVGVEVIAGDTIGLYGQHQGIPLSTAGHLTSYTLAAMVVGYLVGIVAIPRWISQQAALTASAVLGVLLSLMALALDGLPSVLCIALLGLANALVWPAIWPLAIRGLGRHTRTGSAMLIMAISGGALMPLLYGALSDVEGIGPQQAYWVLVPGYLIILWYGMRGWRIQRW